MLNSMSGIPSRCLPEVGRVRTACQRLISKYLPSDFAERFPRAESLASLTVLPSQVLSSCSCGSNGNRSGKNGVTAEELRK